MEASFDDGDLRAAEHELARALGDRDPVAWVDHYTEDAVFVSPGSPAVEGRDALLEMARSMRPLSSVSIVPLRTEGSSDLAAVYARASWVSGADTGAPTTSNVRLIIVWRKGPDERWRVAQELLHGDPQSDCAT